MLLEKITHGVGNSFSHKKYPYFTMPWHYHPEYELMLITSGGGKRFVGDYIDDFAPGELVLYGPGLPHHHLCHGLTENDPARFSSCEVIQFDADIFPAGMDRLTEFRLIADLLRRSRRGIKFLDPPAMERMQRIMNRVNELTGIRRIAALLRLLEFLGRQKEYKLLIGGDYRLDPVRDDTGDPVNIVYKYLDNHFREEIRLDDVARLVNMNASSLCRHFKKKVQKSIFECLGEIRIGFACKLLTDSGLPVSQIAYESGYRNISNFNRQFRRLMGHTPADYRLVYHGRK